MERINNNVMRVKYLLIILTFPFYSCISSDKMPVNSEIKPVQPGIYNVEQYVHYLKGKNIGIVANNASLIETTHLIDTIFSYNTVNCDSSITIKAIFSPEHGFSGSYDAGQSVEGEKFGNETVKIVSLYGEKKKPTGADLEGLDVLVFDLQDVGVRFYTYISTLHYVMQACAEYDIDLIVLDRPNPHCNYIDGPVLESKYKSFVGMHPVPVIYGMTIGEYALMINGEGWLGDDLKCNLNVIPISNFTRNSYYKIPHKPSPNLPNMRSIYLYPSLCFFEGTVMSVGRGTDYPFQVYGHPEFSDTVFNFIPESKPGASVNPKYKGKLCYGEDLRFYTIDSLKQISSLNLDYLIESYDKVKGNSNFFNNYFEYLAGTDSLRQSIIEGKSYSEIKEGWQDELKEFGIIREKYLIYK